MSVAQAETAINVTAVEAAEQEAEVTSNKKITRVDMSEAEAENTSNVNTPNSKVAAEQETIDTSRVFTIKHQNGEVFSGTVLEMKGLCEAAGSMSLKGAFNLAEAAEFGQRLREQQQEEVEEEAEEEAEEQPEESTKEPLMQKIPEKAAKKTDKPEPAKSPRAANDQPRPETQLPLGQPEPEATFVIPARPAPAEARAVNVKPPEIKVAPAPVPAEAVPVTAIAAAAEAVVPASETDLGFSEKLPEAAGAPEALNEQPTEVLPEVVMPMPELRGDFETVHQAITQTTAPEITAIDELPLSMKPAAKPHYTELVLTDEAVLEDTEEAVEIDAALAIISQAAETRAEESDIEEMLSSRLPELAGPVELRQYDMEDLPGESEAPEAAAMQAIQKVAEMIERTQPHNDSSETGNPADVPELSLVSVLQAEKILDRIMELPAELEISGDGEELNTEGVQDELEELFIALFETVGIEYTPQLVEAAAKMVLRLQLEAGPVVNGEAVNQTEDKSPTDRGTHEVINRLLISLSQLKQSFSHALALGQSALRLCLA